MAAKGTKGAKHKIIRKSDYSYLPPYMRYSVYNPTIRTPLDEMTDELRAEEEEYDKVVGKPDIPSLNYYLLHKGNPERLVKMYATSDALFKEYSKRREDQTQKGDSKQIADILKLIRNGTKLAIVPGLKGAGKL
jgi:hypothetical protein